MFVGDVASISWLVSEILYLYVLRYKVDCNTLAVTMLIHNV